MINNNTYSFSAFRELYDLALDDTINPSEIAHVIDQMRKRKEVENKYKNLIKWRDDGRPYLYMERKQIIAADYDRLIDKLLKIEYGYENASLESLFPEWVIWRRDYSSVSVKTIREDILNWNSHLKDTDISKIPLKNLIPRDFTQLFRSWTKDREMTRKKFNNIKSVINGIYYYAIEMGIVAHNPVKDINCNQFSFQPVNNDDDVYTMEDRKKLLEYLATMPDDIYALAIRFDFQLIARIGELLALKWSDITPDNYIHFQRQFLGQRVLNDDLTFETLTHENVDHIKGNTDEGFRYEPLTDEALEILKQVRELNPDSEYIFVTPNEKQLNENTFNTRLKKYCNKCGVTYRSSHKIRFCGASILYELGVSLTELKELLGHTTIQMTLHYLRRVKPKGNVVRTMNEAFKVS